MAASAMAKERQQNGEIERVEKALIAFEGPWQLDAAEGAARQDAIGEDDAERGCEEEAHGQPGRQKEPGSQLHEKVISSAVFQVK